MKWLVKEGVCVTKSLTNFAHSFSCNWLGHPLIRHALEIVYNYLFNGKELNFPGDYLGTGAITIATQQAYNFSSYDTRDMICRGFYHGTFALSNIVRDVTAGRVDLKDTKNRRQLQFNYDLPPAKNIWLLPHKSHPNITNTIPQHISMIYLQRDGQYMDKSTNPAIKLAHDSWTIMNPGYDVRFFNLLVARKYLEEYFHPVFLRAFDCVQAFAGKADLFRLVVLYRDGGWYSDWKQKCLKENLLTDLSHNNTFVSSYCVKGKVPFLSVKIHLSVGGLMQRNLSILFIYSLFVLLSTPYKTTETNTLVLMSAILMHS